MIWSSHWPMNTKSTISLAILGILHFAASPASCVDADFLPLELGNRWIYVHEIVNGSGVGHYSIDTCAVEGENTSQEPPAPEGVAVR